MTEIVTPRGTVTVRTATADDAVALRELRLEALASHPEAFAADPVATAAEPAEAWVERMAANARDHRGVICVASADGQLIGLTGLARERWPKASHGGTIWGVYVRPDWRGYHVAEALLEGCITWAKAQGMAIVKLGVVTTNSSAIRCYLRCGFSVYGVDPMALCYDDRYCDELLMARRI